MTAADTRSIVVVPANEVSWADLQAVFGERGVPHWCQCQWFKFPSAEFDAMDGPERRERFAEQTGCGDPAAVEGYPLLPRADGRVSSGDLYVGTVGMFESAGFTEVSRPTERRAVMRIAT